MRFYELIFAVLCFAFFIVALQTKLTAAYIAAAALAMLSRTAKRKGWLAPWEREE